MTETHSSDLPIRCTCGALRGVLREPSRDTGNRCVCYCDDCQSFAYFLERADSDAWIRPLREGGPITPRCR